MAKDLEVDFSDLLNVFDDIFGKEHMNNFREKFGVENKQHNSCCNSDQCCTKAAAAEGTTIPNQKKYNIFDEFRETLENKAKKKTFKRCEYETMLKALAMLRANYNSDGICQNIEETSDSHVSRPDTPSWNWEENNYIVTEDRKYKTVPLGPEDTDLIYPGLEVMSVKGNGIDKIFKVKYVLDANVLLQNQHGLYDYSYEELMYHFVRLTGDDPVLGKSEPV